MEGGVDADPLTRLVRLFESAEDATQEERANAERDRDYYDGIQLTAEEVAALKRRRQPVLVINRVRRKIDYLVGLERQGRTDPRAYARNPQDEGVAEAATDALRFVADQNDFPSVSSNVWANMLIDGAGGCEVIAEPRPDGASRVRIEWIPWDRMFWDPHSRRDDFRDALYLGAVVWMDYDDAVARWPDAEDSLADMLGSESPTGTYDDRPPHRMWVDAKRRRVRVVQMAYRDPWKGWCIATFTRGGFLEGPMASPYLDEDGAPSCPFLFQSAYIDRENRRYGAVRDMIGPQDEVNKRRSKALHLLTVRQVIAERGAVEDVDAARREVAKPDGYVEVAPGMRFEIQQTTDLAAGQAQLLAEAKAELDMMGPNASMQGRDSRQLSGRAIALQQQGGIVEAGALLDLHRQWKRRVYGAVWDRIRQFWTEETWVRVTDDERNMRFVGLNRRVTLRDRLAEMGEPEALALVERMGLVPGDPRLDSVVAVENQVGQVPVDIVLDEAPDVVTLQAEQFAMLADMVRAGLPIPPDVVIEASALRNKEKILERMRGTGPDGQPLPPPPDVLRLQLDAKKHEDSMELKRAELGIRAMQVGMPKPAAGVIRDDSVRNTIDAAKVRIDGYRAVNETRLKEAELALRASQGIAQREPAVVPA